MKTFNLLVLNNKTKLFLGLIAVNALLILSCNNSDRVEINDKKVMTYSEGENPGISNDSIPNNVHTGVPDISGQYDPVRPNIEGEKPDPGDDPYANVVNPPLEEITSLELVFHGDDILSFNTTTWEIVLSDVFVDKLLTPNDEGVYMSLALYCNDNLLFKDIKIVRPYDSNLHYGFISLNLSFAENFKVDSQQSFMDSYKKGKKYLMNRDTTQKYKEAWDVFIRYLTEEGKIVNE